jgi:hypothetical protein
MHTDSERGYEVGKDEAWFANIKRTYDEYQSESLESIRRNRSHVDQVLSDAQKHKNNVDNVALQALQNAVETANMVGKNAMRHSEVAADANWSEVEAGAANVMTARAVTIDDASLKAIGASIAAVIANMATGRPPINPEGK